MCGIAGLFDFSQGTLGEHQGKVLRRMLDRLRHRGPDDRGEQKIPLPDGGTLFLGHERLSIIDLTPGGHQPMANDAQTLWITSNSEIYNYRELRDELAPKHRFSSHSDTEVLLKAYEEWGVDCLEKLRGMFAFAIWDARRQFLFLARDRLGIKPLYYHSNDGCFLFASEVRALLASGIPETAIDPTGLFHYLNFGSLSAPHTLLQGICELPPGHHLQVTPAEVKLKKYWDPSRGKFQLFKQQAAEDTVRQSLEQAVQMHMISDAPLGAFLSGGIDSSAITAFASGRRKEPLPTLSVGFHEEEFDESPYANMMARRQGTDHHVLTLDEAELLRSLPAALAAMDQPSVDGINTWFIARSARQNGWSAALSGLGGDEIFGGYESFGVFPKLSVLGAFLSPLPSSWRHVLGGVLGGILPAADKATKLAHFFSGRMNGSHPYFLIRALFCEETLLNLHVDRKTVLHEIEKHHTATRSFQQTLNGMSPMQQISWLELTHYMPNTLLRDTDVMGMAHGLEIRVPFLDHKLVELIFSLPTGIKTRGKVPKPLLVGSVPNGLPSEIVYRKKMGFTLPFQTWMRNQMQAEMESVLLSPVASLSHLLSEKAVHWVWQQFLKGKVSWSRPWALYVLKKWAANNLKGN